MNSSNYIVSSLKYRPQNFNDVVGQSHITTSLQNAIKNNHIPQAILFCGGRGTGKTTCARILAKEINKINDIYNDDFSFNIFELDAASNNSVDDIRRLIEQVHIPPQRGIYKVYIIDEVHMLSTSAFNAFLKTLEEPPKHSVFILATTEKNKIIPTILSRCQIFDFKKISIDDISSHLKNISKTENIKFEDEAIYQIAKKAEGGLRDALSIFDKMATLCEDNITLDKTLENLNILDYDYYFKILNYIYESDIKNTMITFNEIINKGFDSRVFISGLASHIRDIMMAKMPETINLLEVGIQTQELYKNQAQYIDDEFIIEALKICEKTELNFRNYHNQRLLIEINLLKLSNINELKKKLLSEKLEKENNLENSNEKINLNYQKREQDNTLSLKKEYEDKSISDIYKKKSINLNVENQNINGNNKNKLSYELISYFINNIKNSHKILFTILSNSIIELDENVINIKTKNNTSKKEIEEKKSFIIDYFYKNYYIINLSINVLVEEFNDNSENIIYGDDNKWKYLISKNNLIEMLIKDFDFDF